MQHPTIVRIEYWNSGRGDWGVGHATMSLLNPAVYVQKLAKREIIARAVNKETGETFYGVEGADLL